jgi:hypothetical protein
MNVNKNALPLGILVLVFILAGCATTSAKRPSIENEDIDIFLVNYQQIHEMIRKYRNIRDDERENYYQSVYGLYGFFNFYLDTDRAGFNIDRYTEGVRDWFNRLISLIPPAGLDDLFGRIGWQENGNEKYWTIYFCYIALDDKISAEEAYHELKAELRELSVSERVFLSIFFGEEMREGKREFDNEYKRTREVLKIFNKSTLEIMENRYEELERLQLRPFMR